MRNTAGGGEPNGLVKARFEFADGPVHQNHGGAFIHAQHAAKPVVNADDIAGMKPERMGGLHRCLLPPVAR